MNVEDNVETAIDQIHVPTLNTALSKSLKIVNTIYSIKYNNYCKCERCAVQEGPALRHSIDIFYIPFSFIWCLFRFSGFFRPDVFNSWASDAILFSLFAAFVHFFF